VIETPTLEPSSAPRVRVEGLSKTFYFYRHPIHRLTHWLTRGRHGAPTPFHALKNVSFAVPAGTSTGIIGVNGAGKSTLLKIITGTMEPSAGSARIDGRIASLLELGTGFHPLFTGRQNIVYNARFLGLTDDEIQARIPEIEDFSELGEFLDRPLRTYSSGMHVRLAFSVAASVNPDVLVIDEVLSVGDAYFQPKCVRRIREFRDRGVTILFVSHDPGAVKSLCDRALLLHDGTIVDDAAPAKVLEHYNAVIARKKADSDYLQLERGQAAGARHSGTFAAVVSDVDLLDAADRPIRALTAGARATLRIRVFFFEPVREPTIGFMIRDRLGNEVWGTNTSYWQLATGDWQPGESLEARIEAPFALGPGEYSVAAAVHTGDAHVTNPYDWVDGALVFAVVPADTRRAIGVALLQPEIAVRRAPEEARAPQVLARVFGDVPAVLEVAGAGRDLTRAGWYGIEGGGADAFRWTAGECSFLLSVLGPEIWLELAASRPAGTPPVEVVLRSLGRELGRVRLAPGPDWQTVRIAVPPEHPPGAARLELLVNECWRPRDTGHGPDPRTLGVCVRRIWSLEPAQQTAAGAR
jgi:lipopolysaccharide transport system ATP-binding protein